MKEKFKELLEQSTNPPWDGELGAANEFNLEKFAELIVQECVICAEREWIRNGSDTEHNQAVSKVIESIKQHFGVK
tara:strand:- start:218 stop:445 length:228 start_codon:yes stop_codon:yes gene_type:complete